MQGACSPCPWDGTLPCVSLRRIPPLCGQDQGAIAVWSSIVVSPVNAPRIKSSDLPLLFPGRRPLVVHSSSLDLIPTPLFQQQATTNRPSSPAQSHPHPRPCRVLPVHLRLCTSAVASASIFRPHLGPPLFPSVDIILPQRPLPIRLCRDRERRYTKVHDRLRTDRGTH